MERIKSAEGIIIDENISCGGKYSSYRLLTTEGEKLSFYTDCPANFSPRKIYRLAIDQNGRLLGAEPIKISWLRRLFSSHSPNRSAIFLKCYSIKVENKKFSNGNGLIVNIFFVFLALLTISFGLGLANNYLSGQWKKHPKNPLLRKIPKPKSKTPKIS
ncbi:MAG: hypothetical protein MRECE_5c021 [Mycoplasmataceae bacterium CE_OT135]|nr:MAG: hypothetical protein MRECE_5c021 [Mycoplasmataceae bacterium CE_OT135]